jgi:hypothetical protein
VKVHITVHHTRLGTHEYRVIRPAQPLTRAILLDRYSQGAREMHLNNDTAYRIGVLWTLAARSARSLIHLPLRDGLVPWHRTTDPGTRLELVLAHHSLQFPDSRWKQLRTHLGAGRPQTATLPATDLPADDSIDYAARRHRENRDLFHQHLHAETLFMTGSAQLFRETARRFLDIAEHGPSFAKANPAYLHYCTEFHEGDGILANARGIHIEYCDRWL